MFYERRTCQWEIVQNLMKFDSKGAKMQPLHVTSSQPQNLGVPLKQSPQVLAVVQPTSREVIIFAILIQL